MNQQFGVNQRFGPDRWEYRVVSSDDPNELEQLLNKAGEEGFQIVKTVTRPVPPRFPPAHEAVEIVVILQRPKR